MDTAILEPLDFYEKQVKQKHRENSQAYFNELLEKSGVDVEENKRTVEAYNEQVKLVGEWNKKISGKKILRAFLIVLSIVSVGLVLGGLGASEMSIKVLLLGLGTVFFLFSLIVIFAKINKVLKNLAVALAAEEEKANELMKKAQEQTFPLIRLFDDEDIMRLAEKTMPQLQFDQQFTPQRLADFEQNYDYIDLVGENASVLDSLSGKLFGNPFLFERYLEQKEGSETYFGSLEIEWVTIEKNYNDELVEKHHRQTLRASVEKPKPYYFFRTALNYGHHGAPDLNFSRDAGHVERLTEKALQHKISSGEKQLQKQARKAMKHGEDFTEMTNAKFDVLFNATDRDHEQQFRMLFTPLAQTNMVNLLCSKVGTGDDFLFVKRGKLNVLSAEHAADWDMNISMMQYCSHDIRECREKFLSANDRFLREVYYSFAPLLAIPLYQQPPVSSLQDLPETHSKYTRAECEILAWRIGAKHFAHEDTVTDVILKAGTPRIDEELDTVNITAYSFAGIERVDFVSVKGDDGEYHNVPVPWIEYIPVEKTSEMAMRNVGMSESTFYKKEGSDPLGGDERWACYHGNLGAIV